jgi:ketosteroid isomerase-like protein
MEDPRVSTAPLTLQELVDYWQTLSPASLARIDVFYTEDAYFRDPFNELRGRTAIAALFGQMFERLHDPRFVITETVQDESRALLVWDFTFRIKSFAPARLRRIHGSSLLRRALDGRVAWHRDYWDAAGELYEQLPLVGQLLRLLRRQLA